jgi:flagellar biosynthesis/type III secretory pathway M-ring protein FliF/YscJ
VHADPSQEGPAAAADRSDLDLVSLQLTIGKTPLRVAAPLRVPQRNNDGMVALGLILLVLVAVLVIAIVVSNPQTYNLSIFGAVIPANGAGIFITGAIAMAVTILALLLLRIGMRRARARRKQLKALETSGDAAPKESTSQAEPTTTDVRATDTKTTNTKTTDAEATDTKPIDTKASGSSGSDLSEPEEPVPGREKSAPDLHGESSTTRAERQAMLDEANQVTRDEPQR